MGVFLRGRAVELKPPAFVVVSGCRIRRSADGGIGSTVRITR
jgi:hypothetical protein